MTLFTLSQLVLNAGPNCTTFLLPVEVFPTRVRASAHGIAAASGKAGALLTAFAFGTVVEHIGIAGCLGLFSGIMFLAALITLMIPETKDATLDDIENDRIYKGRWWGQAGAESASEPATPDTLMKGSTPAYPADGVMKDLA